MYSLLFCLGEIPMTDDVEKLKIEIEAAHKRIANLIERLKSVEHYLGIRSHQFEVGKREYYFRQVHSDVIGNERPKSQTKI